MVDRERTARPLVTSLAVLVRRFRLIALIAVPVAVAASLATSSLGGNYESSSIVTFSPRPDILVGGDVLRLSIPRYATLATSDGTLDAVRGALGVGPGEDITVLAEIPPETVNLHIAVTSRKALLSAQMAQLLAAQVVEATKDDQLFTATVLVPPVVPDDPSGPSRVLLLIGSAILGLATAVGTVLTLEALRPGVWSTSEAERSTGAPVLGVIPRRRKMDSLLWRATLPGTLGRQVRGLRWRIEALDVGDLPPTLVVTAPTERQGSTTIASALAVSLAGLGRRVALVDGDFDKAGLTSRIRRSFGGPRRRDHGRAAQRADPSGLPPPRTLVEIALNPLAIGAHWWRLTVPDLQVLPAQPVRAGGHELAHDVDALLNALRFEKDWVILDTSAVFGDGSAEVLYCEADLVLLVVNAGSSQRDVRAAADVLRHLGANLCGVVLNGSRDHVTS